MSKDSRAQLLRRLDAINAGQDQAGAHTLRALASPAERKVPNVGRYLTLLGVESVTLARVGQGILMKAGTKDEATQRTLDLVNLLGLMGPDRVRECRLEGCGKWFIATKRQLFCSPEHGNRLSYLTWKKKHKSKPGRAKRGR